jgi:hypothetical protein
MANIAKTLGVSVGTVFDRASARRPAQFFLRG